ncbi:Glycerophosphodiester phosphodiesterase domain-containing protein 5 [Merluccius polli]|uniref:Glycerophosphodiester phosphodiesterase domain-containing protein 5 n=1 Tax=Merluccius polli TaxID=89951 RepID=A0AA47M3E0_MERPO|nr:Glycerophosphodiester phosphodiesterase domain-containing protein 5 [Merluccius polli]
MEGGCGRVCFRGFYSCSWRRPGNRVKKHEGGWLSFVFLVCLLTVGWMYICLVTFNDRDDVNWKGFSWLKQWVNWFMVVIIISTVLTCYCILLLVFALFQIALKEPLHLHWLHKVVLFFGVVFITLAVIGISCMWTTEWPTVLLSLQATGPFLQIGAVVALTLLSWFVFHSIHTARRVGSKILIGVTFTVMVIAVYLSPLLIQHHTPCLVDPGQIPPRPQLIGHRGAPMLAPENTMMSFKRSVACNVTAFETDVQISGDKVPFLMHDHHMGFLLRTTDAKHRFSGRNIKRSSELKWEELQNLNAGEWFLKTDPFHTVSQLSVEEEERARNQTIPSLLQLLDLAQEHSISIMFDLKNEDKEVNDAMITVKTIQKSGIDPRLILWLPPKRRSDVIKQAPDFKQVYSNIVDMERAGGSYLNLKYSSLNTSKLRELGQNNVTVNLWVVNESWLFSLLWCTGVSSVTTNSCHRFQHMSHPDWTLGPTQYISVWITVDLLSLLIMSGLVIYKGRLRQ